MISIPYTRRRNGWKVSHEQTIPVVVASRVRRDSRKMYVRATYAVYNVTTRTLVVGLVTLYCMNSKSEHVLSIGNGFDVWLLRCAVSAHECNFCVNSWLFLSA